MWSDENTAPATGSGRAAGAGPEEESRAEARSETEPAADHAAKQRLRRTLRAARSGRANTTSDTQRRAAASALASLARELLPRTPGTIACYEATAREPDLTALIALAHEQGHTVLVPVYQPGGTCEPRWRASESDAVRGPEALADAAVVFIPALAVDRAGTRLGQGGGWYDRALMHATRGSALVGVVFDDEILEAGVLPREDHDVPLTAVMTPTQLIAFTRSGELPGNTPPGEIAHHG